MYFDVSILESQYRNCYICHFNKRSQTDQIYYNIIIQIRKFAVWKEQKLFTNFYSLYVSPLFLRCIFVFEKKN